MLEICDLCKVLSNPLRLELLAHIYQTKDGCNFGYLVDKMQESKLYEPGLCSSGVSQYLRELVRINIVRRHRDGATQITILTFPMLPNPSRKSQHSSSSACQKIRTVTSLVSFLH